MYLKEKWVNFCRIKNIPMLFFAIFELIFSAYVMISLYITYHDRPEVLLYAKATPECIVATIIGIILLIYALISKHWIADAHFYSSYFESDLDGFVEYEDLAEVMGKKHFSVKFELHLFRLLYMKNYSLKAVDRKEKVVLDSKVYSCYCKNCAALIQKKEYFTGSCSYCGSSDLFAKVLTKERFYSISNSMGDIKQNPEYFKHKKLNAKLILMAILLGVDTLVITICLMMSLSELSHYFDQGYLKDLLLSGESYSSYALIKREILDLIMFGGFFALIFTPGFIGNHKKLRDYNVTVHCAEFFAKCKKPFVEACKLPKIKKKKNTLRYVRNAIRRRYLINCTLEKHSGELKVALAKKIVKDECPTCGAAIVGAVDANYKCRYCGNLIMDVVVKK